MLGESHDVYHEFPEMREQINALLGVDSGFADMIREHDQMDAKIRDLELHEQPVADPYMEDLKKQRALLKDQIYTRIRAL